MKTLDTKDVAQAIKFFIEFGGIDKVNENGIIVTKENNEPIEVVYNDKTYPIKVFGWDNKLDENCRVLNLFRENVVGDNKELGYFMVTRTVYPGYFMKRILIHIIEDKKSFKLPSKIQKKLNKEMKKEIEELSPKALGTINYIKKKKMTVFTVPVLRDKSKYKIKDETKEFLEYVYKEIFGTLEFRENFQYSITVMEVPILHSTLVVLMMVFRRMAPYLKDMFGLEFDFEKYKEHLDNIREYEKLSRWFAQADIADANVEQQSANTTTPVNTNVNEMTVSTQPITTPLPVEQQETTDENVSKHIPPWRKKRLIPVVDDSDKIANITTTVNPINTAVFATPQMQPSPWMQQPVMPMNTGWNQPSPFNTTPSPWSNNNFNGFQTIPVNNNIGNVNPF